MLHFCFFMTCHRWVSYHFLNLFENLSYLNVLEFIILFSFFNEGAIIANFMTISPVTSWLSTATIPVTIIVRIDLLTYSNFNQLPHKSFIFISRFQSAHL